jgi:aminopeptidase N
MYLNPFHRFSRQIAAFFLLLFAFSTIASARPDNPLLRAARQDAQDKKLPPANYIRSRTVDIQNVAIDLKFNWEKEQAFGTTDVTLTPFRDLDKFTLDAAAMTINSVTLAKGAALKFNYDEKKENDNLEVQLDRVYKPGEVITVRIDYATNYVNKVETNAGILGFGRGLRFIKPTVNDPDKPRQIWSQGETEFNRYWFPGYDSPNDFRTSELRATVEKPFTVISNGKLMSVTDNPGGTRTFYWKLDTPYSNYLTSIVVGEYAEVKGEYAGIPVNSYVYKDEYAAGAATTKNLPATVKFFSEKTGIKYPYPKYSQTMVEDFGGGMENISATTQIREMIRDERELLDGDSEGLQSHELAHQWFGDYVTCRDWGQIWLNESFATYFQALWDEELKGHDEFLYSDILSNQNQYFGAWNQGIRRPIVTKFFKDKDAIFDAYVYPRGGAVLHMLRKHLGDDAWWKAINHYLVQNAHKPVSTEDFRIAVEESTGQSMDWFFDEWLFKMGHPIFEVTQNYDEAKKQLTLNVKQIQKIDPDNEYPQADFFQTFVEIEIDGKIERVWIKPEAENVYTFDTAAKPKIVNFDYESTLIKELKFEKTVADLIYQMQNDKDVLGRNWAMQELKEKHLRDAEKSAIYNSFLSMLEKDSSPHNRLAALRALRQIAEPEPTESALTLDADTIRVLQIAAKDKDAPVRAEAFGFLAATRDAKYAGLYLAALNDRSYTVIENAASALAYTKDAKAFDALTRLTNTASWHDRIANAGWSALGVLGDKRVLESALKIVNDKKASPSIRSSALVAIGGTGKGDPRVYPLIAERFKAALAINDFEGIFSSVEAIIKIADPRGQEIFDTLRERFKNTPRMLTEIDKLEAGFKAALTLK